MSVKVYPIKTEDGRTVYVTIPPRECSGCSGDGRQWDDARARFVNKPCPECQGSGDEPEPKPEKASKEPSDAFKREALRVARSVGASYARGHWEVVGNESGERSARNVVRILEGVLKGERPTGSAYEAYLLGFHASDATDMLVNVLQAAEAIVAGDIPAAEKHIAEAARIGRVYEGDGSQAAGRRR